MQIWEYWKQYMTASSGATSNWMDQYHMVQIAFGPFFFQALEQSDFFTNNLSEANFIFVTRFGGFDFLRQSGQIEKALKQRTPSFVQEYDRHFKDLLNSTDYVSRHGHSYIFDASFVYSPSFGKVSPNSLFLAADPNFGIGMMGKQTLPFTPKKIMVPLVVPWTSEWVFNLHKNSSKDRKYFLTFTGALSFSDTHIQYGRQRTRYDDEWKSSSYLKAKVNWNTKSTDRKSFWIMISESKYCLVPIGHAVSTLREHETMVVGCVPVLLFSYEYAFQFRLGPYTQWSVVLPPHFTLLQIVQHLESIPNEVYLQKHMLCLQNAHHFMYKVEGLHEDLLSQTASANIIQDICSHLPHTEKDLSTIGT